MELVGPSCLKVRVSDVKESRGEKKEVNMADLYIISVC